MSNIKNMAQILDGIVVNVSLWDGISEWNPEHNIVEIPEDSHAGIGWSYINNEFIDNRQKEEMIK